MSFRLSRIQSYPIEGGEDHGLSVADAHEEVEEEGPELKESRWQQLLTLLTSSPYDIFLSINESIESIDWDSKATTIAKPAGDCLTLALYVTRLLQDNLIKPNNHNIGKKHDSFDLSRSQVLQDFEFWSQIPKGGISATRMNWYWESLRFLKVFLQISVGILLVVNLLVAYKFLSGKYQIYSLFYCHSRPRSNNVTKRSFGDLSLRFADDISKGSIWEMAKYLFSRKQIRTEKTSGQSYYQLKKWTPGKFYAALFSRFSPVCFVFLLTMDVSFKTALPLVLNQYLSYLVVFGRYEDRLDDEACLAAANLAEINEKIIKPKTAVKTQDAMVDATQYGGRSALFFPSFTTTRSHLFQTHTVTGDTVTERFNPANQTFEDVVYSNETNNYVNHDPQYMANETPRQKAINGASVRPFFWSRQPSPTKIATPPKFMHNGASPTSAPLTPNLRPSYGEKNDTSARNASGIVNRTSSINRDYNVSRLDNFSRLRRNSASPIKSVGYLGVPGTRSIHRPIIGGDSSISFSMDGPNTDIPFEEVFQRGRRSYLPRDGPPSRSSAISSRNSSISPSKGNNQSFRRDSIDSRPPFR
ncbi:LADA_0F00672g1_1 [Lachancea dasiensis]|uniref:Nuclear rim protein 1 n=1 Tax=Lachancea dasiensis TaxID=1072105 RepID=A0A1G4JIH8_9SACH|nr:LADA_0F00672g1_1 [Lachancea dasiensis]